MKKFTKLLGIVLIIALVMSMGIMAFAADDEVKPATGTITITTPNNTNADETVTYKIYKVFSATVNDATGTVAYRTLDNSQDVPAGFTADANGYITDAPTSLADTTTAFKDYAKKSLVETVTAQGPSANAVSGELAPGYYYVETSSGAAVMVTPGGKITIADKNVFSNLVKSAGTEYDENAKKAIAAVGTNQPFTIVVTKQHNATKLVVSDTMTGMTLNNDITVTGANADNYTIDKQTAGFTITFKPEFVKSLADGTKLTINYTGKVTSDALQTDPGKNTATLTTDNDHTVKDEVEVYNAKLTINKVDENKSALAGAGFTLYKKEASATEYVKVSDITTGTTFEWKGLGVGSYKIEETTVPAGYTKANDIEFTVVDGDYDVGNLIVEKTVENKSGSVLPSTGGIGTTIFYVVGSVMVLAAGVLLVTRKRMGE